MGKEMYDKELGLQILFILAEASTYQSTRTSEPGWADI